MSPANKERGEIAGSIGKLDFVLEPTFEKIQKLEAVMGRSLIKLAGEFAEGAGNLSFGEVAQIIHIMAKEPIPTLNMVGDALIKYGFTAGMPAITEFLNNVLTGGAAGNEEAKTEEKENDTA